MPINSSQLAYFTNLDTTQLSDILVQSGGQPTTFISAKFMEVTNLSLPSYTFTYDAYINETDHNLVFVTYDSDADTVTAVVAT
jgi:hypothetical protein